ncbi:MAG TPA: hypothetical protein VL551_20820 [Actinospica sp.]|jgi:hypothetical protein|nr:hypothetical protein [Actinospica sp.]
MARSDSGYGTRLLFGHVRGGNVATDRKARFLAGAFRLLAASRAELEEVSAALDRLAAADAGAEWDPTLREWFATALLVQIAPDGRAVTVINHGYADRARPRLPLGLGHLAEVEIAIPVTHSAATLAE